MQSYDKNNELISTDQGDVDELNQKIKDLKDKATHHVIGHLPERHDVITVNGLKFQITYVDKTLGKFYARLLRPQKEE